MRGKDNGDEEAGSNQTRPTTSRRRISHVRLPDFIQNRSTSGRRTTQGQADPLHALVAASRLELDHVVTRRWLRQLKELCVTFRSLSTWAFVSNCTEARGQSSHHCPDETRRANASPHKCRAFPAENDGGGLWKTPHTNHR